MGWMSVKDRLPNKLQKVLFHWVFTDSFGMPCIRNVSMGYLSDAGWDIYLPYQSYGLRDDLCHVTHWMELPDYPKLSFKKTEVGEIIIDDPLAKLHKHVYEELMVHGECTIFIPNEADNETKESD